MMFYVDFSTILSCLRVKTVTPSGVHSHVTSAVRRLSAGRSLASARRLSAGRSLASASVSCAPQIRSLLSLIY
jgi:hypothetical protein